MEAEKEKDINKSSFGILDIFRYKFLFDRINFKR